MLLLVKAVVRRRIVLLKTTPLQTLLVTIIRLRWWVTLIRFPMALLSHIVLAGPPGPTTISVRAPLATPVLTLVRLGP